MRMENNKIYSTALLSPLTVDFSIVFEFSIISQTYPKTLHLL